MRKISVRTAPARRQIAQIILVAGELRIKYGIVKIHEQRRHKRAALLIGFRFHEIIGKLACGSRVVVDLFEELLCGIALKQADPEAETFVPVARPTMEEILRVAERSGQEPVVMKEPVTGLTYVDYSDIL